MIPVQIELEGFMSYRDAATMRFDGAALWMLCGRNGAGKSTVFDAMKWALFGTHRDGTQGAENLIHHEKSGLRVAFDFALGPDVFRVQRTLSRKGRPSFQVFHVEGPNAPRVGAASPQAVPETDSRLGLNRWIEANIGLSEETFGAAVMLQQGKSEALLSADPAARHAMLSQIVDVSAFERLHERAEGKRRDLELQARSLQTQLQNLPVVDQAVIARLKDRIETLSDSLNEAGARLETNLKLQVHAVRWADLEREKNELQTHLERARELLAHAPDIERGVARWEELSAVLPRLQRGLKERARLTQSVEAEARLRQAAAQAEQDTAQAEHDKQEAARQLDILRGQHTQAEHNRSEANTTLLDLSPALNSINECERLSSELKILDEALSRFAPDLDELVERARLNWEQATETKRALPWLERFAKARDGWHDAGDKARAAETEVAALSRDMKRLRDEKTGLETNAAQAATQLQSAQREETQAETRLQAAQDHQARFEQVAGEPNCSYCGQQLTPAHREREANRLAAELSQAHDAWLQAGKHYRGAQQTHDASLADVGVKSEELDGVRERGSEAHQAQKVARLQQGNHLDAAQAALQSLPEILARRVAGDDGSVLDAPGETPVWLQSEYPSPGDWDVLRAAAASLEAQQTSFKTLQAQQDQRNAKQSERTPIARRLRALEESFPAAEQARLRATETGARQRLETAAATLKRLAAPLAQSEKTGRQAETALVEANRKRQDALTQAAGETAAQSEIRRALDELRGDLPPFCAAVLESDIETAGQMAQAWQREQTALQDAEVGRQWQELEAARQQEQTLQSRLKTVAREVSAVPLEAHRAPGQLETQAQSLRGQIELQSETRSRAEREKADQERQAERRQDVEEAAQAAGEAARLHKILADSLGRDALQRHLLQEAETAIVDAANSVLDRISSGTLHLQLQHEQNEENGASDKAARRVKALEMVAFNRLNGADGLSEKPLPVAFLSGSQRFRVAVALALGIGHYASQGARRVESVIIDEGFGSLDKEGRHEMIDELHHLQNVLKRVILVSHQDEFADAFTNRYIIELQGGTSRASLQA